MIIDVVKIFIPSTISFALGIAISAVLSHYLYKYKMWKKIGGKKSLDGKAAPVFNSLHKEKEVGVPRMGGIIIWLSAFTTTVSLWLAAQLFTIDWIQKIDLLFSNLI